VVLYLTEHPIEARTDADGDGAKTHAYSL
jgi:hypothetical protein